MTSTARTAIIVQARMGSTRLPGKVMRTVAGRTLLSYCLARCRAIPGATVVVCATTTDPADQAIVDEARRCGVEVFRGSETDVLGRYLGAARMVEADVVMRVTSDCPLIDPELCGAVLRLRADRAVDYACNNDPPGYPHGLDCEAFTTAALARADAATEPGHDREHVTPWLRREPTVSRAAMTGPGGEVVGMRWTLDYPEDLAFFEAILPRLSDPVRQGWREIADLVSQEPALAAINAGRRQR